MTPCTCTLTDRGTDTFGCQQHDDNDTVSAYAAWLDREPVAPNDPIACPEHRTRMDESTSAGQDRGEE